MMLTRGECPLLSALALARRFLALPASERGYFLRRFVDHKLHKRSGYSQFGEDASVASYLRVLGRSCRNYLDIGANDPVLHSNSYLFYRDGGSGVLVEANPAIARRLRRKRPRDLVVNVGVVAEGSGTMQLHVMDMDGLSTLSEEWRETVAEEGLATAADVVTVPVIGINDLLLQHGAGDRIDFASLDIEGLDFAVLKAWDFDRWRPYLFCIETANVSGKGYRRNEGFASLMEDRSYAPLFSTFANTIFVDTRA
jgi:FkbM family methyltransferase